MGRRALWSGVGGALEEKIRNVDVDFKNLGGGEGYNVIISLNYLPPAPFFCFFGLSYLEQQSSKRFRPKSLLDRYIDKGKTLPPKSLPS